MYASATVNWLGPVRTYCRTMPSVDHRSPTGSTVCCVCEAIVALFAPLAEVAVHDLRRDRIVGIWNPISKRKIGDRCLIDKLPAYTQGARVIGPYPKSTGRRARDHVGERRPAQRRGCAEPRPALHQLRPLATGRRIDLLVRFAAPVEGPAGRSSSTGTGASGCSSSSTRRCRSRSLRRDRLTRAQRLDLIRVLSVAYAPPATPPPTPRGLWACPAPPSMLKEARS